MCAIVDNNVRHQVFGGKDSQTPAGEFFLNWLDNRKGKLVVGGKLLDELSEYGNFSNWLQQAVQAGNAIRWDYEKVAAETAALEARRVCRSDDAHVLALARVSGARLLFSNDRDLQDDFGNREIIHDPRGRVYTTQMHKEVIKTHKNLLNRTDLCAL